MRCSITCVLDALGFDRKPHRELIWSVVSRYGRRRRLGLRVGRMMNYTVGPASAIVIDVIQPGIRATGASVLALFSNLFGLASIAGVLSDAWELTVALTVMPAFGLLAALAFSLSARIYEAEMRRAGEPTDEPASTPVAGVRNALA
jgi:hypothetical protein